MAISTARRRPRTRYCQCRPAKAAPSRRALPVQTTYAYPVEHSPPRRRAGKAPHRRHVTSDCAPPLRVTRYRCTRYVPAATHSVRQQEEKDYHPAKTRESFIIGKIQWQRELCRCVQMDLIIGLQKNAKSLSRSMPRENRAGSPPGCRINVLLLHCRPHPAQPLPDAGR